MKRQKLTYAVINNNKNRPKLNFNRKNVSHSCLRSNDIMLKTTNTQIYPLTLSIKAHYCLQVINNHTSCTDFVYEFEKCSKICLFLANEISCDGRARGLAVYRERSSSSRITGS